MLWGVHRAAQFLSEGLAKPEVVGWEGQGREQGQGGLYVPAHAHASFFCFVFSGPRLRPWQKESRKPTKVSPLALGWRSLCLLWVG